MIRKNNCIFLSIGCTLLLAGCSMSISEPSSSGMANSSGSAVFNSERIIALQEKSPTGATVRKGYSIIKTANSFDPEKFVEAGGSVVSESNFRDGYKYFLIKTERDDIQFRSAVRNMDGVLYAQPDYSIESPKMYEGSSGGKGYRKPKSLLPFGTGDGNLQDDPEAEKLDWGLTVTHALEAFKQYDAHDAVNTVLAAIIDTGINGKHEDFYDGAGNSVIFYAKASMAYGVPSPLSSLQIVSIGDNWDNHGHGTHCSGTIAAVGNNGKGICGVSHANTKLISYRGMDASGGDTHATYSCLGDLAAIVTELRKEPGTRNSAVLNGLPQAVIDFPKLTQTTVPVNMSLGGLAMSPYEVEMLNKALAAGVLPVIAMGNDGKTVANFPAALQGVLAVGATAMNDTRAYFSDGGTWMSVCAPGEAIYSCSNGGANWANSVSPDVKNTYRWMSGTSMATPFVTGTIAYLLSIDPTLSPYRIKTVLERTADKIDSKSSYGQYDARGYSKWYGYGRVNVLNAAKAVQEKSVPQAGSVYSEKAVKISVKKSGTAQQEMRVWVYEKRTGVCASCGFTDAEGNVSFYGLRSDTEYEIGINADGTYHTYSVTPSNDSDTEYTFLL
ncbi:hypothetical protein HMPREF1221_01555 [Treponema socranskii subsp. paredis ATCC 35535]|nr:hypothetical protein HMPREF1221_01555 [Treponema socranskii subsp. paredis ATCC 35535]